MAAMPAMANPHPHIATAAATAPTSRHEPETARHRELSLSHVIMANEPLAPLRCCCGRTECIFLQHNCTVLESVENDVRIAARLGQSLLERHEAYMADAERDRAQLISRIEQLEMDKRALETENARNIEENRSLLDQLETLNNTVSDSDTRIKMLEASLQSSQLIIRRLDSATERSEEMERHLSALESEQAALQNTLVASESEARSAIQRWKRAERGIADLQYQLEKMEQEARQEKERHMEIIGRMERQRVVERELSTAAGRLKGAAAAKSLQDKAGGGGGVVTHFVRDLLQDNATMQLGMAELREMLMNSNDEIQQLRDQLMFHQPLAEEISSAASTLRAELGSTLLPETPEMSEMPETEAEASDMVVPFTPATPATPATPTPSSRHLPTTSQELHIHHHYHMGNKKKAEPLRPKKRRTGLMPNIFSPPSAGHLSRSVGFYTDASTSSPSRHSSRCSSRHLSRDSVSTTASVPSNRWSVFSDPPSELTMSSLSSSPLTHARSGFCDSSLPTSPATSVDLASPHWRHHASSPMSMDGSFVCGSSPPVPVPTDRGLPAIADDDEPGAILEEVESEETPAGADGTHGTPAVVVHGSSQEWNAHPLHRCVSHESIISLHGGLDIHTLKARPSQLTLRPLGTYGAAMADTGVSSVTAKPVMSRSSSRYGARSSTALRDPPASSARGLGRLVGWRPWGGQASSASHSAAVDSLAIVASTAAEPAPESVDSDDRSVLSGTSKSSGTAIVVAKSSTNNASSKALQEMLRAPGINQPGIIPGFFQRRMVVPSKVHAEGVDHEALRDGLEGP